MSLLYLLGFFFVVSSQPVIMVLNLIFFSMIYSFFVYMNVSSYWYSYMMLLVMLSGVLVVFTYMTSMSPNESMEYFNVYMYMIFILVIMGLLISIDYLGDMSFLTVKLWEGTFHFLNLYFMSVLFVLMVMVVYFSMLDKGPVRIM